MLVSELFSGCIHVLYVITKTQMRGVFPVSGQWIGE